MGLDWGFELKNKSTNQTIPLMSFCGWNSKTILGKFQSMFELEDDTEATYVVNEEKLITWLDKVNKINKIFGNISERRISNGDLPKRVIEKYADLCYELDIEYDDFNIFTLMRLSIFGEFLKCGDLTSSWWWKQGEDWYIVLTASW